LKSVLEELAFIRMSPQQCKSFVMSMSATLMAWEEVLGEITLVGQPVPYDDLKATIQRIKDASAPPTQASASAAPPHA
jgi:hypothetical protein